MKLQYHRDTGSLYIDLNASPSADSREVADGLVIDLDSAGRVVGIDIQHASQILDLDTLELRPCPPANLESPKFGIMGKSSGQFQIRQC